MKHADQLIERILFLEGVPNLSAYDKISVGSNVKHQLENDLGLEQAAMTVLEPGIKACLDAHDERPGKCSNILWSTKSATSTGSKPSTPD